MLDSFAPRKLPIANPPKNVASTVEAVMAQRLVRRLCKNCREAWEPTKNELPTDFPFDQIEGRQLYRAVGCRECRDVGYTGRMGVYELLVTTGFAEKPFHFLPGTLAVNVGMVHIMLPFMLLPMLATMRSIDRTLISAAGVLGANPWVAFRKIFFPLSLPGVGAGSALVFMMSLGFFITPALLGGPQHMMAAVLIEQQANQLLNWGLASALSTVLLVLTSVIYLIYLKVMRASGGAIAHAR